MIEDSIGLDLVFIRTRLKIATIISHDLFQCTPIRYTKLLVIICSLLSRVYFTTTYPIRVRPVSIFIIRMAGWQPFYSLSDSCGSLLLTYSTGSILSLLGVTSKQARRDPKRGVSIVNFLYKYLPDQEDDSISLAICSGYKKRYDSFLQLQLFPFLKDRHNIIIFSTKLLTCAYKWRRVAPIKKRIRNRLGIRTRLK